MNEGDRPVAAFNDSVPAEDFCHENAGHWFQRVPLDPGLTLCEMTGDGEYQPYFPASWLEKVRRILAEPEPQPTIELVVAERPD